MNHIHSATAVIYHADTGTLSHSHPGVMGAAWQQKVKGSPHEDIESPRGEG